MDLLFRNPQYFLATYFDVPPWEFLLVWLLLFGAARLVDYRLGGRGRKVVLWDALLALVFAAVLSACLLNGSRASVRALVLDPRATLVRLFGGEVHTVRQVCSNILLYAPVGMVLGSRVGTCRSVVLGLLLSVCVEGLQYYMCVGTTELMDVLANTAGTTLGVVAARGWQAADSRFVRRDQPSGPSL